MRTIWAIFRFVAVLAALLFPQLASAGVPAPKAETCVRAIDVVVESGLKATSLCEAEARSAEAKFAAEVASRCSIATRGGGEGITLRVRMEEGFDATAFNRKVSQLQTRIKSGEAIATRPHGVSDSARRSVTRAYRKRVAARIETLFANNPTARTNALRQLRGSDIDHILDLQLGGANDWSNLKALHSVTNQGLGRQIAPQLPVGERVPIVGIEVVE